MEGPRRPVLIANFFPFLPLAHESSAKLPDFPCPAAAIMLHNTSSFLFPQRAQLATIKPEANR